MVVVIGVIAVLAGLLVSGIRGAIARSRKLREETTLRALATGWTVYCDQNSGGVLPGFLEMDPDPDRSCGPFITLKGGTKVPWYLCQTYPFRMLPYLDYQTSVLRDGMDDESILTTASTAWEPGPDDLPKVIEFMWGKPGSAAALQPNFGYNAYYVGGWVDKRPVSPMVSACWMATTHSRWLDKQGVEQQGDLVLQNVNLARNPDKLITFASSTYRTRGEFRADDASEDYAAGVAWVLPPALGHYEVWNAGGDIHLKGVAPSAPASSAYLLQSDGTSAPFDSGSLIVTLDHGVPIRRHSRRAAVLTVDGSIQSHTPTDLMDMRRWINNAWHANFRHNDDPGTGPLME